MSPFLTLLLFCGAMFLGSLAVGLVPLSLRLDGNRLQLFSVFGSGLLLGTGLLVIIPEGIDSLYRAMPAHVTEGDGHAEVTKSHLSPPHWVGLALTLGFAWMFILDTLISILTNSPHHFHHGHVPDTPLDQEPAHDHDHSGECGEELSPCEDINGVTVTVATPLPSGSRACGSHPAPASSDASAHSPDEGSTTTTVSVPALRKTVTARSPPGAGSSSNLHRSGPTAPSSLRSMTASQGLLAHPEHHHHNHHTIPVVHDLGEQADTSRCVRRSQSHCGTGTASIRHRPRYTYARVRNFLRTFVSPATIGMLIHAAADGLALGSASASAAAESSLINAPAHGHPHGHTQGGAAEGTSLIIFMAIFLHKAPEAFGLCTQLLQEGQSRAAIRTTLVVFSLAAPLMALTTYAASALVGLTDASPDGSDDQSNRMLKFTAILLLFSAGTFLYVAAIHSLPETMCNDLEDEDPCTRPPSRRHSGHPHHHHGDHHHLHHDDEEHALAAPDTCSDCSDTDHLNGDGLGAPSPARSHFGFKRRLLRRLGILLVGMLLPAFIAFGHTH
ncbi:hypothetical protein IWQ60_010854 [Tieghemiomyces parasiticus]|uniref:Uncharacterized protein n=1 Tax=Tieghemiomyces parasiticus TaxID=78921 RepID=A0A9W7ZIN6_9FUNG|nr:hypothetical protein IWQ60_010854 [Tieghemiomyces parasiticus]